MTWRSDNVHPVEQRELCALHNRDAIYEERESAIEDAMEGGAESGSSATWEGGSDSAPSYLAPTGGNAGAAPPPPSAAAATPASQPAAAANGDDDRPPATYHELARMARDIAAMTGPADDRLRHMALRLAFDFEALSRRYDLPTDPEAA